MHTCALNPTHSVLNEQSCPSAARPGFRVRVWRIIPATRCHVESFAGPIPDQSQQDRRGGLRVGLLKLLGDAHMESMLGQAKPGRAAGTQGQAGNGEWHGQGVLLRRTPA